MKKKKVNLKEALDIMAKKLEDSEIGLKIGDRVVLNKEIVEQMPEKFLYRQGTVVGFDRNKHPKINWDGTGFTTAYTYHPTRLTIKLRINKKIRQLLKEQTRNATKLKMCEDWKEYFKMHITGKCHCEDKLKCLQFLSRCNDLELKELKGND